MKINRLETHDRLQYLKQDQSINIFKGAEDCLKKNSLSLMYQEKSPYIYLFAHPRTLDNGNKAMYWHPRLSKPLAQTNSYLFRAISKTDIIEICWLIPPREQWNNFNKGNVISDDLIGWSIQQYKYHRNQLELPHENDMPEAKGKAIIRMVLEEQKTRNKPKQEI